MSHLILLLLQSAVLLLVTYVVLGSRTSPVQHLLKTEKRISQVMTFSPSIFHYLLKCLANGLVIGTSHLHLRWFAQHTQFAIVQFHQSLLPIEGLLPVHVVFDMGASFHQRLGHLAISKRAIQMPIAMGMAHISGVSTSWRSTKSDFLWPKHLIGCTVPAGSTVLITFAPLRSSGTEGNEQETTTICSQLMTSAELVAPTTVQFNHS